ncbi:CobW family GTP-binding protein [Actinoplanes auranticolor]|uniref:CobW family GTP-binding protein n=1 Tax=Actinoplanes auranticolor TaxID=47988 RepID=UPI001FE3BEA4|nr:GTP-binding protein [Actinoplanes auranticolor]
MTTAFIGSTPSVDTRPRVTVLAGFSAEATAAIGRSLLVTDRRLLLVSHDMRRVRDGVVRRTVRTADAVLEQEVVELVHGCVSCTLREDVLPTLLRLARQRPDSDILLALPPVIEPEAVAAACAHAGAGEQLRFDSYVTVVEAAGFLDDLASTEDLRDRDLHAADEDRRGVAEVVVRQVEYADTIVVWGHPQHDALDDARLTALLHRLAPWATHLRVGDTGRVDCTALAARLRRTGRHDPRTPGILGRALEGFPIGIDDPAGEHGANSVLFRSRRPFHPVRLHEALEDLTTEALRVRGQFWIASQPDTAIGWESAGGGVSLGTLGYWLAALPAERWPETSGLRRMAADVDWDPYYGDRRTVLALVGLNLDAEALTARLTECLLTDRELAEGFEAWPGWADPFAGFFPLTDEDDTAPA